MRIMLASMHGSSTTEVAILCQTAGIELLLPCAENGVITSKTKPTDESIVPPGSARIIQATDVRDAIPAIDAVMLTTPEQVLEFRNLVLPLAPRARMIVRHSLNSFGKYASLKVRNFLTCSPRAARLMTAEGCNCFVSRKLMDWRQFGLSAIEPEDRHGLDSYVHHMATKWPEASARLDYLNDILAPAVLEVVNHGYGAPGGAIDDLARMRESIATVHLKDGNAACNAVCRSMAVGTPVLMDRLSHERCFFDGVDGIRVHDTLDDLAADARALAGDPGLLDEACEQAYRAAREQFSVDDELVARFRDFMSSLS